jgi:hypothetical protein
MENTTDIVILELDPPRELKLGHRALKAFCARTRLGVNELGDVMQRYDMMALLIAIMLQVRYPELTDGQIDEMLDELDLETVIRRASEAIFAAFPSLKQNPELADGTADPFGIVTTGQTA